MTPGSIMLGNAGQCYECGHDHAAGDRCVSFSYEPEYFEQLAADAGARADVNFGAPLDRTEPQNRTEPENSATL
jgi:AraC family transcriptional regulator